MKSYKFLDANFEDNIDEILNINEHYDDCHYDESMSFIPMNECMCRCYEKRIFEIGMQALEKLFYGGADRGNQREKN